jgi:hypothetical protein
MSQRLFGWIPQLRRNDSGRTADFPYFCFSSPKFNNGKRDAGEFRRFFVSFVFLRDLRGQLLRFGKTLDESRVPGKLEIPSKSL